MANERGVCFDNKNIFWLLASQKQELLMQIQNISSFLFAERASVSSIRQEETAAFVSRFRQSDFSGTEPEEPVDFALHCCLLARVGLLE